MALSSPSTPPAPGYFFAQGDSIKLADKEWHTLRFNMSSPEFAATGFTPTDIVQIGVQFASGLASSTPVPNGAAGSLGTGGVGGAGGAGGAGGMGAPGRRRRRGTVVLRRAAADRVQLRHADLELSPAWRV